MVICILWSVSSLASKLFNVDSTGMRNLRETLVISSGIGTCEINEESQVRRKLLFTDLDFLYEWEDENHHRAWHV